MKVVKERVKDQRRVNRKKVKARKEREREDKNEKKSFT